MQTNVYNRHERTLSACVAALTLSPNTTILSPQALSAHLSTLLPLIVKANSTHAKDIHLKTFTSLHSLFERLPTETSIDEKAKGALEKLMFDPSFEGLPEAMRMKRAEALVVVGKASGSGWVAEKVKAEVDGGERSPVVRAVLAKIGKQ
jgi:proteasome component ECM29